MSHAATAQAENEDRYYTQVEAGDVRLFTLDQLDAAFNADLIHENTYVCLEGSSQWLTLAEVAGLGDEEPAPAPAAAPVPVPYRAAPTPASYSSPYYVPPSIAPVVNDLSLDDSDMDMMSMRPKRRLGKVMAGLTVCALAGLGFMVVQSGGIRGVKLPPELAKLVGQGHSATASIAVPKAASTPAVNELPRAPAEAPRPEPVKAEEPKSADPSPAVASTDGAAKTDKSDKATGDDRFSEEMKEALLNKDKKQSSKLKGKKAARAAIASKRASAGKTAKAAPPGFKAGGSAYDPLNAKL
jgi:hypothetical protein